MLRKRCKKATREQIILKLFLDFHPKFSISNNMCTDIWYSGSVWSTWTSHGIHGRHYDSDQHYLKEKYISKQTTHALPQNCRVRYYPKSAKYRIFKGNFRTFLCNDFFYRAGIAIYKNILIIPIFEVNPKIFSLALSGW